MGKERKQYQAGFKFRVALEAAKNGRTVSQLASEHGVHPTQINDWKGQLMREGAAVFERRPAQQQQAAAKLETELYEQMALCAHFVIGA